MSFTLRKNGRILIQRKALHWWITGFKLGEFSDPDELTMEAKIKFPNRKMRDAFVEGLYKIGYHFSEFSVRRTTVTVQYTKPHTAACLTACCHFGSRAGSQQNQLRTF